MVWILSYLPLSQLLFEVEKFKVLIDLYPSLTAVTGGDFFLEECFCIRLFCIQLKAFLEEFLNLFEISAKILCTWNCWLSFYSRATWFKHDVLIILSTKRVYLKKGAKAEIQNWLRNESAEFVHLVWIKHRIRCFISLKLTEGKSRFEVWFIHGKPPAPHPPREL